VKDNVLDLLIYLFENYMSADDEPRPDRSTLKLELDKAGFAEPDIERALEWLDGFPASSWARLPRRPLAPCASSAGRNCCDSTRCSRLSDVSGERSHTLRHAA